MNELINQSVSDGGDCRTAPATPGLLKIYGVTLLVGQPSYAKYTLLVIDVTPGHPCRSGCMDKIRKRLT